MHHNKAFVKKNKKGNVLKVVREHYLRDDIWSGTPLDPECDAESHKLSGEASHYIVIDTNVALHHIDFLEHSAITDVIICSVVLEEVKHKNQSAYQRLRALTAPSHSHKRFYVFANEHHRETYIQANPGEGPNDRNDRAIRVATKWYADRLKGKMKVLLLTNDVASRKKALEEGVEAMGVYTFVRKLRTDVPELLDLVSSSKEEEAGGDAMEEGEGGGGGSNSKSESSKGSQSKSGARPTKRKRLFPDHLTQALITSGLQEGRLHQGSLRVNRFNPFEGYVGSESVGTDILITGREMMNRAMDGDIVAVELLPESEWRRASSKLPTGLSAGGERSAAGGEEEAEEGEQGEGEDLNNEVGPAGVFQVAPGEHMEEGGVVHGGEKGNQQPTGKVVAILKRNWRSRGYCGSLKPLQHGARHKPGTESVLFLPVEQKFPAVRIHTRQAEGLMDKRIVVVLDSWDADSLYPSGHYVRTLGVIGDKDTETEVILIENDINTSPFTPAVHDCVPPLPWAVGPEHEQDPHRMDLRHLPVCSVDPPGCKDIDDALHVRSLPNGNLEVGVHIADVTHFLKPCTAMDQEASVRATTTYLVQRRIDMLPKPLTEDICSLRGGQERLTFSVIWEMNSEAEILSSSFTKAIIRSRAAMTYAEAQARIDDSTADDELSTSLKNLNRLAKKLRQKRAERGALQLASPEVKFKLETDTQDPMDVGMYQVLEANQMVEEMMLLANISVAEKIARHFPSCSLLRRHPTPAPRMFDPILKAAAAVGLTLDVSSSKALAESLDAAVRQEDPYFNKLVRILSTRCMTQALYFGSGEHGPAEYHHYGLASPIYTHFTSPIRRYADVVVHRLLAAALELEPLPEGARDRAGLKSCSENLNTRHRNAQMAGRASVELHTLIFFNTRTLVADARVTRVKSNGLLVFVPKYGIEGPVFLTAKAANNSQGSASSTNSKAVQGGASKEMAENESEGQFVLDEEKQTVTSRDGKICFRVFDPCAVAISVQEGVGHRRSLVLQLISREEVPQADRV